jgi:hypothetical protein
MCILIRFAYIPAFCKNKLNDTHLFIKFFFNKSKKTRKFYIPLDDLNSPSIEVNQ